MGFSASISSGRTSTRVAKTGADSPPETSANLQGPGFALPNQLSFVCPDPLLETCFPVSFRGILSSLEKTGDGKGLQGQGPLSTWRCHLVMSSPLKAQDGEGRVKGPGQPARVGSPSQLRSNGS